MLMLTNVDGDTPLHSAAYKGYGDACKVLLQHGADVNAKDAGALIRHTASGAEHL